MNFRKPNYHFSVIALCSVLICQGCNNSLPPRKYAEFILNSKNGLYQRQEAKGRYFTLLYKPLDYVALMEIPKEQLNINELGKVRKQFEGMTYFTFSITNKDGKKLTDEKIPNDTIMANGEFEYFNFLMQRDFFLISGKDTAFCTLFHYEHNYGVSPENRFLLGFEKNDLNLSDGFKVLFDGHFIEENLIEFDFPKEITAKIPLLSI